MTLTVETASMSERAATLAPEAFDGDRPLHYWAGLWRREGPAGLQPADAARAVRAAFNEHRTWSLAPLAERTARVTAALGDLDARRDLLAHLLAEETGTAVTAATAAVDRCLGGVRGQLAGIGQAVAGRVPLRGPVSNIPARDCPAPVLVRAALVQALAGNAAIVKAPEAGGVRFLALAVALAGPHGLPLTLVAGGPAVDDALGRLDVVGCVSHPVDAERGAALVRAVTRRAPG
ncbi:aldehyde dehydrogenase family protein [Prauserella muralis]|uniref:Uncharacterized protein n=1 Tax=Prauserella muralis TaxID=588067 RepID=A0A2V4AI30_9PSEU|nr:aldehyde dehydrogenase family protein [Prauserella muralis]PXY19575.1 hypothetical protein BAY60_33155 [Prauserella muralis]TWE29570.1 aldehyde dehydrogenase family protein [Prauserella muralis]